MHIMCTTLSISSLFIYSTASSSYYQYAGVVYQAKDKQTNEIVALKRCLPHHEASDGFPLTTLREITILRELQCAGGEKHGIIGLKDVTVSSRYVYVVLLCDLII